MLPQAFNRRAGGIKQSACPRVIIRGYVRLCVRLSVSPFVTFISPD